jgi:hypothetical protein
MMGGMDVRLEMTAVIDAAIASELIQTTAMGN